MKNSTANREIKKSGLIALLFFGSLSALGLWMEKSLPTYLFGFLSIIGFGLILIPSKLKPAYTTWLKIAHFFNRIITIVILTLVYFTVITPMAMIKRLFGGRPLPLKPDTKVSTYWVDRTEPAQPKERFLKRY